MLLRGAQNVEFETTVRFVDFRPQTHTWLYCRMPNVAVVGEGVGTGAPQLTVGMSNFHFYRWNQFKAFHTIQPSTFM